MNLWNNFFHVRLRRDGGALLIGLVHGRRVPVGYFEARLPLTAALLPGVVVPAYSLLGSGFCGGGPTLDIWAASRIIMFSPSCCSACRTKRDRQTNDQWLWGALLP